jgi:hypothetical protein
MNATASAGVGITERWTLDDNIGVRDFAKWEAIMLNTTAGLEESCLDLDVQDAGTLTTILRHEGNKSTFFNGLIEVDSIDSLALSPSVLNIGASVATSVTIADSGIDTAILGTLTLGAGYIFPESLPNKGQSLYINSTSDVEFRYAQLAQFYYSDTSTITTINSTNVYVTINGANFTNSFLVGFTRLGSVLTYTGNSGRSFLFTTDLICSCTLATTCKLQYRYLLNGSVGVASSRSVVYVNNVDINKKNMSISNILSLVTGDTVELQVRNTTSTDNVDIQDCRFVVVEV